MRTIPQVEPIRGTGEPAVEPEILLQARIPARLIRALRHEATDRDCYPRDLVREMLEERYHDQPIGKGKRSQQSTK